MLLSTSVFLLLASFFFLSSFFFFFLLLLDSGDGLVVVGAVSIGDLANGPRSEPRARRDPRSGESRAVRTGLCGSVVPPGGAMTGRNAASGETAKNA